MEAPSPDGWSSLDVCRGQPAPQILVIARGSGYPPTTRGVPSVFDALKHFHLFHRTVNPIRDTARNNSQFKAVAFHHPQKPTGSDLNLESKPPMKTIKPSASLTRFAA